MKRKTDNFNKFFVKKSNGAIKEEIKQEKKAIKKERRESIENLDAIGVPYSSIINHPLPDHPWDDCPMCRQNWILKPRG